MTSSANLNMQAFSLAGSTAPGVGMPLAFSLPKTTGTRKGTVKGVSQLTAIPLVIMMNDS